MNAKKETSKFEMGSAFGNDEDFSLPRMFTLKRVVMDFLATFVVPMIKVMIIVAVITSNMPSMEPCRNATDEITKCGMHRPASSMHSPLITEHYVARDVTTVGTFVIAVLSMLNGLYYLCVPRSMNQFVNMEYFSYYFYSMLILQIILYIGAILFVAIPKEALILAAITVVLEVVCAFGIMYHISEQTLEEERIWNTDIHCGYSVVVVADQSVKIV